MKFDKHYDKFSKPFVEVEDCEKKVKIWIKDWNRIG